jgi:hypothetical protein
MRNLLVAAAALAASLPQARAVGANHILWQAPQGITRQDWIWGQGGPSRAPRPPYEFIEEDSNGTNAKIKVRDAAGASWTVKFGGENHTEVFASRLLNAMGYLTEPSYFVASGVITGEHNLKRSKAFLGKDGSFVRARFKLRDKTFSRVDDQAWAWNNNPFTGSHELSGLKILLMLTSNWDAKDSRDGKGSNTAVYAKAGGSPQLYYAFDDWGATFGKWGGFFQRDKWNPAGYRQQTKDFVKLAPNQSLHWGYRGKHGEITEGVGVEDVRWLLTWLSPVTDDDLRAGLRASGARSADQSLLTGHPRTH